MKKQYDVIVIGGGPAGLASAIAARNNGAESVLIIERDKELGGILNQCIHNGFGLHHFKEELSGPEYAGRFIDEVNGTDIDILLDTMVIEITEDKQVFCTSESHGYMVLQGKALILNMGCRERTRGAIAIPGDRPAGVFTAGAAQRYVNIEGYMVGKRVVIVELMPYSNGLNRNIVQCLNDYNIPLYLSHTITDIKGKKRVEQVIVSKVDENRQIIPGTEMVFDCDCVLLSVGLIPENELTRNAGIQMDPRTNGPVVYENMETSVAGIFASGNVLHVHDLVDFVTDESEKAGKAAGIYVKHGESTVNNVIETKQGEGVGYTVPQKIRKDEVDKGVELSFRVRNNYHDAAIVIKDGDTQIARFKREHMAPAEMEKVMIPKVLLDKVNGNSLTISIEKEGD